MNMVTDKGNEGTLIKILRVLPSDRVEQLVDFARFLEAQILNEDLIKEEAPLVVAADNEQWEALMATDEAQTLLNKMANEALSEHQAGKTKTMGFNNGRIVPE